MSCSYSNITNDGKKTIYQNKKDSMEVIDNNELINIRNLDKKKGKECGNCLDKTSRRLSNYIVKYGVENFSILSLCGIFYKPSQNRNRFIQHTAIYNKKLNKVIDISNGLILYTDFDKYIDDYFGKHLIDNNYRYELIDLQNKGFSFNLTRKDNGKKYHINIKKLDNDTIKKLMKIDDNLLYSIICEHIKLSWKNSKEIILNKGSKYL